MKNKDGKARQVKPAPYVHRIALGNGQSVTVLQYTPQTSKKGAEENIRMIVDALNKAKETTAP